VKGRNPKGYGKENPERKPKGRRASISVEKLPHLGEKTLKTNPDPPRLGLDIGLATQFRKKTIFAMKSQSSIAGCIFGKRTRQRKRMKTTEFNIMLWKI